MIIKINNDNIIGDIVECRVWKGGCSMIMMLTQKNINENRNFYLFDTFYN